MRNSKTNLLRVAHRFPHIEDMKKVEEMIDKWDFQTFSNILDKQGWTESVNYKNNFVPSRLYKYYPLFDARFYGFRKENKKRLSSLQKRQIWVSNYKHLNDPFEFKALFLDVERIKDYHWEIDLVEKCLELVKSSVQVCCFSERVENNMPLWAHYANNHGGYCIEYSVIDKNQIFPVTYIPKREPTATIVTRICSAILKGFNENEEPKGDFLKYFIYLYLSFSCKHSFWEYENEFRLFNVESDVENGKLIPLTEAKLKVEKIFLGSNCIDKRKIINIGQLLGCEVHEMYFDEYYKEFSLLSRRIL